jgi:hypothetical protein
MQRALEGGVGVDQRRQVPVVDPSSVNVLCKLVYCWRPARAPGQRLDDNLDLALDRDHLLDEAHGGPSRDGSAVLFPGPVSALR